MTRYTPSAKDSRRPGRLRLAQLLVAMLPLCAMSSTTNAPHAPVTLETAMTRVREYNPELSAARARLEAARADVDAQRPLPNPAFELAVSEYDRAGEGIDEAEIEASLTQTIELGGKRRLRRRLAELQLAIAEKAFDQLQRDMLAEVTMRFNEALLAEDKAVLSTEQVALTERTLHAIRERIAAGKAAPLEAMRAEAALACAQLDATDTRQGVELAHIKLAAMWAGKGSDHSELVGSLDNIPEELPVWVDAEFDLDRLPEIERSRLTVEAGEAALRGAKADRIPDLEATVGIQLFREDDTDAYLAGIGLPLPLFNRNRAAIARAQAELQATEAEHQRERVHSQAAIEEQRLALRMAHRRALAFQRTVLPAVRAAYEAAHEGYRQGRGDYLDMLDAQREWVAAQQEMVESSADFWQQLAQTQARIAHHNDTNE
jgi:cobalt-zinc-cadmium efflux system outer membrane protein